jgi:hypothetical protein
LIRVVIIFQEKTNAVQLLGLAEETICIFKEFYKAKISSYTQA